MDPSQRANAAQLAARNLKSKPKGRLGRTGPGLRPDSSGAQPAPPSQNEGGIFGGSVQGSGSFSFSAPGMGFAAPSSPVVSDNEGRFTGDDRAMKRQFGGPSTMQPVQQPGGFGQSQASLFGNQPGGSTFGQGLNNPGLFGNSTAQPGGNTFDQALANPGPANLFSNSAAQPGGNKFSFGSSSNANHGPAPASNPFSFSGNSQLVPASPSLSFGSGVIENKPVNSPFQFSHQNAQPSSSDAPFAFGSPTPQAQAATSQAQAPAPVFNFRSTVPQNTTQPQVSKSSFNFGSTSVQGRPAATPSMFDQGPAAPPSTAVNFGTNAPPKTNLFGISTPQPAQTGNNFGAAAPHPPPTQPTATMPTTSNLFGNTSVASPAMNGLFDQSPALSKNNLFDGPARISSVSNETPNLFGGQNLPTPKTVFGGLNKPVAQVNGVFGKPFAEQTATKNMFGALNKPGDESLKNNINGGIAGSLNSNGTSSSAAVNSPFNKPHASTAFGQSAPPENCNNSGAKALLPSTPTPTSPRQHSNIFPPMKPIDASMAASQPPPSGMFPNLPAPSKSSQKTIESESPKEDFPPLAPIPAGHPSLVYGDDQLIVTDEQIAKVLPDNIKDNPQAKEAWITKYRVTYMNRFMSSMFDSMALDLNPRAMLVRYIKLRGQLLGENSDFQQQIAQSGINSNRLLQDTPSKQLRSIGSVAPSQTLIKRRLAEDEARESENPSKRFKEQPDQQQVPQPKSRSNGFVEVSKPLQEPSPFAPSGVSQIGNSSTSLAAPSPTKRKPESQTISATAEATPMRKLKVPKLYHSTVGSTTSNIFKDILNSPSPSKSGSPSKPTSPGKRTGPESKDDTPRNDLFGKLAVPGSPSKPASSPSPSVNSSSAFTPKAPSTSSVFNAKTTPSLPTTFTPKVRSAPANTSPPEPAAAPADNGASTAKASAFKPPVFTSGPVDFLAQFGKKASEDNKDNEEKLLQKAIDADFSSDDDLEEFKQNYREKRKAELKELEYLAKNTRGSGFVPKVAGESAGSPTPECSNKAAATTEPAHELFFGQSTTRGSETNIFSSLNASRTSTPGPLGSSTGSVLDGHASNKPGGNIFGHLSDADSGKGKDAGDESADDEGDGDEENRDPNYQSGDDHARGAETPASETGAGIASVKKSNLFGSYGTPKVSNLAAPASSTPGRDLFSRTGVKPNSSEKVETGSATPRNKIGSKEPPSTEEQSGRSSTPGGSLFPESNGDPVRHISTEEKENTHPSTSNVFKPFANPFNKTPGLLTWKTGSPIRFGSAADTQTSSSAPTVSITAATPTKTGSSTNLFGGPTSAPKSNLFSSLNTASASNSSSNSFGNSSGAKRPTSANLGFAFGAPNLSHSTLRSAAGSANTSRATSPGATTDADSGVDGDPDAEVHEQINLTTGGPGEEDEEVLHEVRAKALMFSTIPGKDGKSWIIKGLGSLRVLQHKDTKAVRILLRSDPVGTVIFNKALLGGVPYQPMEKTVKILAGGDDGKGLETWLLQVKTQEAAKVLAEILEANKPSS